MPLRLLAALNANLDKFPENFRFWSNFQDLHKIIDEVHQLDNIVDEAGRASAPN